MESKNKKGYDLVPSDETVKHLKEPITKESPMYNDEDGEKERKKEINKKGKKLRFKKSFWVCFSNVQIGSRALSHDEKKKGHDDFKVKDGFLFSNVEIEPEEDREKVRRVVEKMENKSCFLIFFSNIQVGKGLERKIS